MPRLLVNLKRHLHKHAHAWTGHTPHMIAGGRSDIAFWTGAFTSRRIQPPCAARALTSRSCRIFLQDFAPAIAEMRSAREQNHTDLHRMASRPAISHRGQWAPRTLRTALLPARPVFAVVSVEWALCGSLEQGGRAFAPAAHALYRATRVSPPCALQAAPLRASVPACCATLASTRLRFSAAGRFFEICGCATDNSTRSAT